MQHALVFGAYPKLNKSFVNSGYVSSNVMQQNDVVIGQDRRRL